MAGIERLHPRVEALLTGIRTAPGRRAHMANLALGLTRAVSVTPPEDWRRRQRCDTENTYPDMFHPDSETAATTKAAKRFCSECPVQFDCLKEAMDTKGTSGVWGGTDTRERHQLKPVLKLIRDLADSSSSET